MNNAFDNFIKGPLTSLLGIAVMIGSYCGWFFDYLNDSQAVWSGISGFGLLFMRDKLPDFITTFFKSKFGGGNKASIVTLILIASAATVNAQQGRFGFFSQVRLVNGDSTQGTSNGTIFYNLVSNKFRFRQNGSWISIPTAYGDISGTLTSGRVVISTGTKTVSTDAGLLYNSTTDMLTVGLARFHTSGLGSNTFIGENAGNTTLSSASGNTGIGYQALVALGTDPDDNTAVGALTLDANTTGDRNTAIGNNSLTSNTAGADNTAVGASALRDNVSNNNNVAVGNGALTISNGGENNIAVGYRAGDAITTGDNNIVIHTDASGTTGAITTGSGNILIGYDNNIQSGTASNQLNIQNIIYGVSNAGTGSTVSTGQIGIGQSNPDHQLHVTGNAANKNLLLIETDDGADILKAYESGGARVLELLGATFQKTVGLAASDETTALTTGTGKVTFRMPHALTVTAVRASLTTAQTSGTIFTVDINEAGVTILSTKLTIDNTEKTSTTAATAAVISDTALADDAEITIDIDQIGDGTAKGLKVWLIGY